MAALAKLLPMRRVGSSMKELSDEALVAASGLGDPAALGELFDRFHEPVYRFLSRLSGTDARDLDDLVQTTFLEVARAARGFEGRSSVSTWIFSVAANVASHHVRSEVRRKRLLEAVAHVPEGTSSRPDDSAEQRELMARLSAALDALPHDLKVAFVMCELEEVPGRDAAAALGVREGTLWRRLHDARKALSAAIERTTP